MYSSISIHTSLILFTVTLALALKDASRKRRNHVDRQTDRERSERERKQDDRGGGRRVEGKYFTSIRICVQIWSWARGNLCKIMLIRLYNMQGAATKQFFFHHRGGGDLSHKRRRVTPVLRNNVTEWKGHVGCSVVEIEIGWTSEQPRQDSVTLNWNHESKRQTKVFEQSDVLRWTGCTKIPKNAQVLGQALWNTTKNKLTTPTWI